MNVILMHQSTLPEKLHLQRLISKNMRIFVFKNFLLDFRRIKDQEAHFALWNDLIDHLWEKHMFGTTL